MHECSFVQHFELHLSVPIPRFAFQTRTVSVMVEDSQANLQDSSSANDSIIQLFKLLDQDNDG